MAEAKTDYVKALALARKISEPWFRCQALAGVARCAPHQEVFAIACEAFAAAANCPDAYQRGAVMPWPIRALSERGLLERANDALNDALER